MPVAPRQNALASLLLAVLSLRISISGAFVVFPPQASPAVALLYSSQHRSSIEVGSPLRTDSSSYDRDSRNHQRRQERKISKTQRRPQSNQHRGILWDPAQIEFVKPSRSSEETSTKGSGSLRSTEEQGIGANGLYPFAAMMQGSAPYIADHAGKTAVFYLPGELLHDDSKSADALLQDMALCWLLQMKIVIVVAGRYTKNDDNDDILCDLDFAHECHNELTSTDVTTLRHCEEEAGYLRTELERKLNRCLRAHGGTAHDATTSAPPQGNVVSGNAFYTAQQFGVVRGEDFQFTGYCQETHTENIQRALDQNDVVLLSTVGMSRMGELVNVNGYHLAASVAAALDASKLIYMAQQGAVLQPKHASRHLQELSLSDARALTDYHGVVCHNTGFATFHQAKQNLDPAAVELLLHLGWSAWAVEHGCTRAHVVNPGDGALLEELFTAENGVNTCLFHDNEGGHHDDNESSDFLTNEWDAFFQTANEQQRNGPSTNFD